MANYSDTFIQNYLMGQGSKSERQAFEADLRVDTELAGRLAYMKLEQQAAESQMEQNLRAQMETWKSEASQTEEKKVVRFWPKALAIAAVLTLIIASYFILRPKPKVDTWNHYLKDHPYAGLQGDPATEEFERQKQGIARFLHPDQLIEDKTRFQATKDYFLSIQSNDSLYLEAQYVLGHLAVIEQDYAQASDLFRAYMNDPSIDPIQKQKGEYYLYLVKFILGEQDPEFQRLIKALSDPDHYYANLVQDFEGWESSHNN